jgi:hypothetical protein
MTHQFFLVSNGISEVQSTHLLTDAESEDIQKDLFPRVFLNKMPFLFERIICSLRSPQLSWMAVQDDRNDILLA